MGKLAEYIKDLRWALNMARARRFRSAIGFSARQRFDSALRPKIYGGVIDYPDAFYHATIEDLLRAMKCSVISNID